MLRDKDVEHTDDFKFRVVPDPVKGHFEYAQVQVRNRAEGAASDEDQGCPAAVAQHLLETLGRELIGGEGDPVLGGGLLLGHGGAGEGKGGCFGRGARWRSATV